jgi:hypothetical protein
MYRPDARRRRTWTDTSHVNWTRGTRLRAWAQCCFSRSALGRGGARGPAGSSMCAPPLTSEGWRSASSETAQKASPRTVAASPPAVPRAWAGAPATPSVMILSSDECSVLAMGLCTRPAHTPRPRASVSAPAAPPQRPFCRFDVFFLAIIDRARTAAATRRRGAPPNARIPCPARAAAAGARRPRWAAHPSNGGGGGSVPQALPTTAAAQETVGRGVRRAHQRRTCAWNSAETMASRLAGKALTALCRHGRSGAAPSIGPGRPIS